MRSQRLDLPFLRVVVTGSSEAQDLYCEWQRIREIEEAGALLVRPDGVVAWRDKDGTLRPQRGRRERLSAAIRDCPRPSKSFRRSSREEARTIQAQRHAAIRLTTSQTRYQS